MNWRADWERVRDSLPAIAQICLASASAYVLAQALLQQSTPLIAAIMPISALGFVGDARPIRVLETVIAMTLGIALAEALVVSFGTSVWTFAVALAVTLLAARFVSAKAAFAISAAVQCTLVMLSPASPDGPFVRSLDALVGGAVAIAATALLPRSPWGAAVRSGRRLVQQHVLILRELAAALRAADAAQSGAALTTARSSGELVAAWTEAVSSGKAIAAVSPWFWRRRSEFARLAGMVEPLDLATRSLRVIARRCDYLVGSARQEPELASLLEQLARAIELLGLSVSDFVEMPNARHELTEIAKHLDVIDVLGDGATASEGNVVHAIRPYMTDALMATGLSLDEARARLARVD